MGKIKESITSGRQRAMDLSPFYEHVCVDSSMQTIIR